MIPPEATLYAPQPGRQVDFVSSSVDEAAWLGEAGTGKGISYALDFLYDVGKPLHNAIVFRKAYKDLEDLLAKFDRIFPSYGGKFDSQRHVWNFPSKAKFWMAYLENEKDVFAWNGHEFSKIYWDELAQFTRMPYLFMMRNLRCADQTIIKGVRDGANPDAFGAPWVWERFVKSLNEGEIAYFKTVNGRDVRVSPKFYEYSEPEIKEWLAKTPHNERGFSRQWFKGVRAENKLGDPDYERNLDMLPTERQRQAYKFGILVESDHPEQLIKGEWIEDALNGKCEYIEGQKAFGMDYSEGGDNAPMYKGSGNRVEKAWEFGDKEELKHPVMARWMVNWIREEGIYQILGGIDTVGTGAGLFTNIADLNPEIGSRINPIRHKDYELEKKQDLAIVKLHFKNIQDQILWKLREDFKFRRIDLSYLLTPEGYYPNLHLLKEELTAIRFKENFNPDGSMWISSSKDLRRATWPNGEPCLGRSPDRLKALAIWNYVRDWIPEKYSPPPSMLEKQEYGYTKETVVKDEVSPYI